MLTFDGSFLPEGTYATPQATIGVEATLMQHQVRMNITKKTPTYYAVMHYKGHTTNVFVKGGFKTLSHSILYQCFVDELKPLFGLAKIGTHIALMHTGKHQQTEYFLIMRDFGPGVAHYPTIRKDGISRIDKDSIPILQMVRWLKVNDLRKKPAWLVYYVNILLFRQIIESSDTNNTNFIVNPAEDIPLLSVDENPKGYFLKGKLFSHKPTQYCLQTVLDFIKNHKKQLLNQLTHWKKITQEVLYQTICGNFANLDFQQRIPKNIDLLKDLITQNKVY